MSYLFFVELLFLSSKLKINRNSAFVVVIIFIVSSLWALIIGSSELIKFYLLYFSSLTTLLFVVDVEKICKFSKYLSYITFFLMLSILILVVTGHQGLATSIKEFFSLPTNSRDITQYGSGVLGYIPLLDGMIVRHVLYFDQPSTFSSFIFILCISVWLNLSIFKRCVTYLLLLVFCPSKIAILLFIPILLMRFFLLSNVARGFSFFGVLMVGFVIGYFFDFNSVDLADTTSARLYWTDLLFSGTAPWNLVNSCVGSEASCVFGVYDGFIVKLPILVCTLILGTDTRYRTLSNAILLSSVFTIQYGINLFYSPLTILAYGVLFYFFRSINNSQVKCK